MPPSPRDWLPENDLVYFVLDTTVGLDISAITDKYEQGEGRGFPPFHPRMLATLLVYSYTQGCFSSRRIEKCCQRDAAYRVVVQDDVPNFRTISDFRKLHLEELEGLFVQLPRLDTQRARFVAFAAHADYTHRSAARALAAGRAWSAP